MRSPFQQLSRPYAPDLTTMASGASGGTCLSVTYTEFAIGTFFMGARVYVNGFMIDRYGLDFWFALSAYLGGLSSQIFLTMAVHYGLGDHIQDLTPALIEQNQMWQWVFTTLEIFAICMGKLAIIAFILQIEGLAMHSKKRWFLYTLAVVNVVINIIIVPIIWTQCTPTRKIWDDTLPGECGGRQRNQYYGYFQGSFGAFLDLTLAIYPMLVFYKLKLKTHVKIGLCVLFGFGLVAAAASCVKTYELGTVTATSDLTYELVSLNIWAATEMWTVFVASCIPTIRPVFVHLFRLTLSTAGGSRSNNASRGLTKPDNLSSSKGRNTKSTVHARADSDEEYLTGFTPNDVSRAISRAEEEDDVPGEHGGIMMTRQVDLQFDNAVYIEAGGDFKTYNTFRNGGQHLDV